MYETEHECIINTIPLWGDVYDWDNDIVYGIMKTLVLECPGWYWISHLNHTHDGHAAWLVLWAHYEGDSFQNHQKESAYASIASSQYQGEYCNISFETCVTLHEKAHLELEWNGEPVPESKKVQDFLIGIQDP